jgi:hypothetical protein
MFAHIWLLMTSGNFNIENKTISLEIYLLQGSSQSKCSFNYNQ